jgi:hypothetical protein
VVAVSRLEILVTNGSAPADGSTADRAFRIDTVKGTRTVEPVCGAILGTPLGIDVDRSSGLLYVSDLFSFAGVDIPGVHECDPAIGRNSAAFLGGIFDGVAGVDLAPSGILFVAGRTETLSGVQPAVFAADYASGVRAVFSSAGNLRNPRDVAVDAGGAVLVVDDGGAFGPASAGVIRLDATGSQQVVSQGGSFVSPRSLDVESSGDVVVADGGAVAVWRLDGVNGAQSEVSSAGLMSQPAGIAVVPGPQLIHQPGFTPVGVRVRLDELDILVAKFLMAKVRYPGITWVTQSKKNPGPEKPGYTFCSPFFDVRTTAGVSGPMEIDATFAHCGVPPSAIGRVELLQLRKGAKGLEWAVITSSRDAEQKIVRGKVDALSFFAVGVRK